MSNKAITSDITERLRLKFSGDGYAFIENVPDGTTVNKNRTADAICMGCWKSTGIELQGFEIKASRSDWRKELNDLTKSAVFDRHCHRWWIVASPGIVKIEEMPANWGLMEPTKKGSGLRVKKAAALTNPEPVSFEFLASLLRKAVNSDRSEESFRRQYSKGVSDGIIQERKQRLGGCKSCEAHQQVVNDLNESITKFQDQTGIRISKFGMDRAVKNFKAAREFVILKDHVVVDRLKSTLEVLEGLLVAGKKLLDEVQA